MRLFIWIYIKIQKPRYIFICKEIKQKLSELRILIKSNVCLSINLQLQKSSRKKTARLNDVSKDDFTEYFRSDSRFKQIHYFGNTYDCAISSKRLRLSKKNTDCKILRLAAIQHSASSIVIGGRSRERENTSFAQKITGFPYVMKSELNVGNRSERQKSPYPGIAVSGSLFGSEGIDKYFFYVLGEQIRSEVDRFYAELIFFTKENGLLPYCDENQLRKRDIQITYMPFTILLKFYFYFYFYYKQLNFCIKLSGVSILNVRVRVL